MLTKQLFSIILGHPKDEPWCSPLILADASDNCVRESLVSYQIFTDKKCHISHPVVFLLFIANIQCKVSKKDFYYQIILNIFLHKTQNFNISTFKSAFINT